MIPQQQRKHIFSRHDRITINAETWRWVGKKDGFHTLQRTDKDVLEDHQITVSDEDINEFIRRETIRVEPDYFTRALTEIRLNHDDTDLSDCNEEELRTIFWKTEWVQRFNHARTHADPAKRPKITHDSLATFIESQKAAMDSWYLERYRERRRPGRPVIVRNGEDESREIKPFDYPSPTALRNWLKLYRRADDRMEAFLPRYRRCGNRSQLDPEVQAIIEREVKKYAARNQPTKSDIHMAVDIALRKLSQSRPGQEAVTVSPSTINRRIDKLNPFLVEIGRLGEDRAMRRNLPVGMGIDTRLPLERVEFDDWSVDLFTLICSSAAYARMTPKERKLIPRKRVTITIGIDCRTRCIVGFNISEHDPLVAASKAALYSSMIDKTSLAEKYGARTSWHMHGRLKEVGTDGGPAFSSEFTLAAKNARVDRVQPDPDPRQRGTIEAFFPTLKRLCRRFAGRSFANVVEKDDYPAEAMANLTFAAFSEAVVKFIVDDYHRKQHRGLGGATPLDTWNRLTEDGLAPSPSKTQLRFAFGYRQDRVTLDKHGLLFAGISYNSVELAKLKTLVGDGGEVDLVAYPENLGSIMVIVDRDFRDFMQKHAPMAMHGHVLVVPAVNREAFEGMRLATLLEASAEVRKYLDAVQKKENRTVRLLVNEGLDEIASRAARENETPQHLFSQAEFDKMMREFDRQARRALDGAPMGNGVISTTTEGVGTTATVAAVTNAKGPPPRSASRRPHPLAKQQAQPAKDESPLAGAAPITPESPVASAPPEDAGIARGSDEPDTPQNTTEPAPGETTGKKPVRRRSMYGDE